MASFDVEEDVMESLKDDLEMMKEKFHENYGMTTEELVDIDFEISVTSTSSMQTTLHKFLDTLISTMKKNCINEVQPADCKNQSSRT